jgi:hypothetical protein
MHVLSDDEGSHMDLDSRIAELSREYRELSTTMRYLRRQLAEETESSTFRIAGYEPGSYAEALRSRYIDGRRRIAEIRAELTGLYPSTLDGIRAKALATTSRTMDREPSLIQALGRTTF